MIINMRQSALLACAVAGVFAAGFWAAKSDINHAALSSDSKLSRQIAERQKSIPERFPPNRAKCSVENPTRETIVLYAQCKNLADMPERLNVGHEWILDYLDVFMTKRMKLAVDFEAGRISGPDFAVADADNYREFSSGVQNRQVAAHSLAMDEARAQSERIAALTSNRPAPMDTMVTPAPVGEAKSSMLAGDHSVTCIQINDETVRCQ